MKFILDTRDLNGKMRREDVKKIMWECLQCMQCMQLFYFDSRSESLSDVCIIGFMAKQECLQYSNYIIY